MTTPSTSHQWDTIWWAIFNWREAVQGPDAASQAEAVNRAIASTVQQHITADRISRAEQEQQHQAERTTHHA
jgi:hypothetical protein